MNHHLLSALPCNSCTWAVVVALAMLTNLIAGPCYAIPNDGFTTDMKAAVEEATEQDKDILLRSQDQTGAHRAKNSNPKCFHNKSF